MSIGASRCAGIEHDPNEEFCNVRVKQVSPQPAVELMLLVHLNTLGLGERGDRSGGDAVVPRKKGKLIADSRIASRSVISSSRTRPHSLFVVGNSVDLVDLRPSTVDQCVASERCSPR